MSNARFCSHCGTALGPGARFCANCGKPTQPAVSQAPAAQPAPARASQPAQSPPVSAAGSPQETVLGVMPGAVRRSGVMGLKFEPFVIVFTNLRVILAAQSDAMLKDNVQQARDSAKAQGKGFFGQWGAQLGANSGQQYLGMSPQQILAEQPGNFFLPANQLRRIRLHEYDDNDGGPTTYTIEFESPAGKHKFELNHMDTRARKKQLQQFYGDIVR